MAYYIHTVVDLKPGQYMGYSNMMQEFAPYMERKNGWKLLYGLGPVTGSIHNIFHVWEIENFGDFARGMEACGADPEAIEILKNLPNLVNNETVTIHGKTPYCP